MAKHQTVLISNVGLPSERIGSWITRIYSLQENHGVFDYILSPSRATPKNIFCQKKKFLTHNKFFRKRVLLYSVARDYIKAIIALSKQSSQLTLVVMDDPHLVEAMAISKKEFACDVQLIYSFHGFQLGLKEAILNKIDKVLFLSEAGYRASKSQYFSFAPKASIVGNGVDSKIFYPLSPEGKLKRKIELGFIESEKILVWMANDRPLKGLSLFVNVALRLVEEDKNLRVLIIGSKQEFSHPQINNIGRVPHGDIAKYLQVGDVYAFTTFYKEGFGLSMIEALKCGNAVVASDNGAVAEVLHDLPNTSLVYEPKNEQAWITAIRESLQTPKVPITQEVAATIWNYEDWETRYIKAIQN